MEQFRKLYDYILENFNLDGTSCRLVQNILNYVEAQGFTDEEDDILHLHGLLGCAFGLEKSEIEGNI